MSDRMADNADHGKVLPDKATGPLIVCYADRGERRVVRLAPQGNAWVGRGGERVDGVYRWAAACIPNERRLVMSHRNGRRGSEHVVLDWLQCGIGEQLIDAVAEDWHVSVATIRAALAGDDPMGGDPAPLTDIPGFLCFRDVRTGELPEDHDCPDCGEEGSIPCSCDGGLE